MSKQKIINGDSRSSYLISSKESRKAGKPAKKKKAGKKKQKGKGRG